MYKSLLEAIFKAMITYGGTRVFDNIEQSKECFSFVLKSNKALDTSDKSRPSCYGTCHLYAKWQSDHI